MSGRIPARGAVVLTAIALGIAWTAVTASADVKLGYIDSARILAEFKGVEDAKRTFDQEVKNWEKQEEMLRGEVDSLGGEYKSQELMLTESMKKEKQELLRAKRTAYDEFVKSIWGPEGRLAQKNAELMKPIIDKVNTILERIGADEKFTMIFDAANGGVVYASPGADLTARVLEELTKGTQ